jgi:hypothetical protein
MPEIHFRSMEAPHNKWDVTIHFLVGGSVIHFARIFHLSGSIQKLFKNSMLVQWLNLFASFGASMTPKIVFANLKPPKRHLLDKICVD